MTELKNKNGKYSTLAKNTTLFMVSSFGSKIISFLFVPLYTYVLSTKEYGIVDLVSSTALLLIPLFTINIQDAVIRYSLDKDYYSRDIISAGIKVNIIGDIILIAVILLAKKLRIINLESRYLLFLYLTFMLNALNNCITMYLKAANKVLIIVISGLINTGVTCILNILLLLVFKMGINGYLIANIAGILLATLFEIFIGKVYKGLSLTSNKTILKEMILYSAPLVANSIAWWVNSASDRYILVLFCGVAANGIYSVSYKIPTILATIQNIFYNAWSISAITEFDKEDKDGFIGNMYSAYSVLTLLICSGLIIINIPLAKILYSKDFFMAWKYVPFLLVGTTFNGLALFEGCIFTAVKQTKEVSKTTLIGALVNIVFNFIFIYFFGVIGAAISTMLGYMVTWIVRTIKLNGIVKMKIKWNKYILTYILLLIQSTIALSKNFCWLEIIFFTVIVIINKQDIVKIITKTLSMSK